MKTLHFKKEPEFADLWDACLYHLLYDTKAHVSEVCTLLSSLGISTESKILDAAAGTGFIALHLLERGYNIESMDPTEDERRVYSRKAEDMGVNSQIHDISWDDIPSTYQNNKFDFIFCRGNSFIYAAGGWNEAQEVSAEKSLDIYKQTLQIFYDQLAPGGYLYIDKYADSDHDHYDTVANIQIDNQVPEELIFYTKRIREKRYREASMIRKKKNGNEIVIPNMTMDLSETELEKMMNEVGFTYKRLELDTEKLFSAWIAQK